VPPAFPSTPRQCFIPGVIRAAVFDLDNTLFDSTTVPAEALAPAVAAVRRANVGPAALPPDVLEAALLAAQRFGFLHVADTYGVPAFLRTAWRDAYRSLFLERAALVPYPDVMPVLPTLHVIRLLLTTGFRRMQESKIAALRIGHLFDGIYIDTLDGGGSPHKRPLLEEILHTRRLAPSELLVIGDSADNEIAAGNALGAITVQVLRPGVQRTDTARHHLATLTELPGLISRLDRGAAPPPR
jgi:FMN phosphatase YigB (HAD superfamily)